MPTTFLFLDESTSADLDIASLTGVLVPDEAYADTRDGVLRIAQNVQRAPHLFSGIEPGPIELHGCDMLRAVPGATDDDRVSVFRSMVDLVNERRLQVISIGYTNWSELGPIRGGDDKLQGLNFFNIMASLGAVSAAGLVVPVMDGLPSNIRASRKPRPVDRDLFNVFIASAHSSHNTRLILGAENISIPNHRNFAEPVFTDSGHSPLLQLADVIGYLLYVEDRSERMSLNGFKARLLEVAKRLDHRLLRRWRGRMDGG